MAATMAPPSISIRHPKGFFHSRKRTIQGTTEAAQDISYAGHG